MRVAAQPAEIAELTHVRWSWQDPGSGGTAVGHLRPARNCSVPGRSCLTSSGMTRSHQSNGGVVTWRRPCGGWAHGCQRRGSLSHSFSSHITSSGSGIAFSWSWNGLRVLRCHRHFHGSLGGSRCCHVVRVSSHRWRTGYWCPGGEWA
jgi:hypothetical protein